MPSALVVDSHAADRDPHLVHRMYSLEITSNIMSLGGIAIAIGAMVDAAIIMVENAHKELEHWEEAGRPG